MGFWHFDPAISLLMFSPALKIIPTLSKAEKEVLVWLLAKWNYFSPGSNSMEEGRSQVGRAICEAICFLPGQPGGRSCPQAVLIPAQQVLCPGSKGWDGSQCCLDNMVWPLHHIENTHSPHKPRISQSSQLDFLVFIGKYFRAFHRTPHCQRQMDSDLSELWPGPAWAVTHTVQTDQPSVHTLTADGAKWISNTNTGGTLLWTVTSCLPKTPVWIRGAGYGSRSQCFLNLGRDKVCAFPHPKLESEGWIVWYFCFHWSGELNTESFVCTSPKAEPVFIYHSSTFSGGFHS